MPRSAALKPEQVPADSKPTLDDAVAAFNPTERIKGKTIIRVRP